jgi:hypothetical protein
LIRVTTSCLPTWRTGWDHSASAIIRSWWEVWAELTSDRILWHRHTKTYSPTQVPQFWWWLHWEVTWVCMYFIHIIILFYLDCLLIAYQTLFPNSPHICGLFNRTKVFSISLVISHISLVQRALDFCQIMYVCRLFSSYIRAFIFAKYWALGMWIILGPGHI